jgi:surface protein
MFENAIAFNQDVSSWDVSKIIDMEYAFKNTNLSIENYNKILNTWSNLDLEPCNFKNNVLVYTEEGSIGRQNLITKGWNIQDDILLTPSTIYVNEPFLLKYNHGIWNSLLWGGSIVMSYKMTILEQIPINSTTRDLIFNPIRISDTGKIQLLVKVIKNNQVVATEYIHLYVNAHNIPVTVNKPRMSMGSLFTDNSMVYYKPHSLAAGGIGGVRNYRKKSKKT